MKSPSSLLSKQLDIVKKKSQEVKVTTAAQRTKLKEQIGKLTKANKRHHEAWEGQWLSDDYNLYRRNYDLNLDEGMHVSLEDMKARHKKEARVRKSTVEL